MALSATGSEVGLGLALGALAFFLGDEAIERLDGTRRRGSGAGEPSMAGGEGDECDEGGGGPVAILLGTILDGIPESVVIGVSLIGGGGVSVAVLAAVLLSNVPEAISSTPGLAVRFGARGTVAIWSVVVAASALAAALGYGLLGSAPPAIVTGLQAFAAGAILVMLTDEMIPAAHARGPTAAGLATAFGCRGRGAPLLRHLIARATDLTRSPAEYLFLSILTSLNIRRIVPAHSARGERGVRVRERGGLDDRRRRPQRPRHWEPAWHPARSHAWAGWSAASRHLPRAVRRPAAADPSCCPA